MNKKEKTILWYILLYTDMMLNEAYLQVTNNWNRHSRKKRRLEEEEKERKA